MGKKLKVLIFSAILALLLVSILPVTSLAKMQSVSATGEIAYISGTVGFPSGQSGNYKVMSRTISGYFTSGDLTGDFSMTYKANVDLNTQAGNFNGDLTTDKYLFDVSGTSYPVTWTLSPDSPVGYIGTSSASGIWKWHDGGGSGSFTAEFSFVPTIDGHIDYILLGSTFNMTGQLNDING